MAEGLYLFMNDNLYVGASWNSVEGVLAAAGPDVTVTRTNFGGGWFVTRTLMMKAEYVNQDYRNFAATDIRNGGRYGRPALVSAGERPSPSHPDR